MPSPVALLVALLSTLLIASLFATTFSRRKLIKIWRHWYSSFGKPKFTDCVSSFIIVILVTHKPTSWKVTWVFTYWVSFCLHHGFNWTPFFTSIGINQLIQGSTYIVCKSSS